MNSKFISTKKMEEKLDKLVSMGFDVSQGIDNAMIGGMGFDLSATNIEHENVFSYILLLSYRKGEVDGVKRVRDNIKTALGLICEDEK